MDSPDTPNDNRRASETGSAAPSSHRLQVVITGAWKTVCSHARNHTGVGLICSVAYFDPGNWGVDLQAGSQFGYRLLFVVLLSGLFAVFLQVLASRLGCVTGLDLASHCRLLFHDRPRYTRLFRWGCLYPLYLLAEVAIITTDLSEMLGSAIALVLLFPKLKLWHGVLITVADIMFLLAMRDPLRGTPVRMFELLIVGLVFAVLICIIVIISKVNVDWSDAFLGFVPSKYIVQPGALYTSVGVIGATVMPHSLFLGSALATQDRVAYRLAEEKARQIEIYTSSALPQRRLNRSKGFISYLIERLKFSFQNAVRVPESSAYATTAKRHSDRENNSLGFVLAHVYHGIVDMVIGLVGFAVVINALILILAGAVFYYGSGSARQSGGPATLFDAYDLLHSFVGKGAAILFAIALLASGQSSSLIATLAGQAVAEGFIQWRVSPVLRRLLTRLIAIIPSMIVAVAVGRQGINTLLVASQVVLSMALPFIMLPLLWFTSNKRIMSVRKPSRRSRPRTNVHLPETSLVDATQPSLENGEVDGEWVDFSNSKFTSTVGLIIWLVIVAANVYVLVNIGNGGGT